MQYKTDDLPNGLRVVTVPTDYPNLVSLYIVVGAGSRNEVEAEQKRLRAFFRAFDVSRQRKFPARTL
jgi:zinc protease